MSVIGVQRRMMLLGRIRMGEKGRKGEPVKRDTFRLTSASRALLESAAAEYGGTVREWEGAPDEGMFELDTEARELDVVIPPVFSDRDGTPTLAYSQWYEQWSAGGCQRRCDGVTEALSGNPCLCNPEDRECDITTRVSVMLPKVAGLGVWRLDTKGWNAAAELPGTLELLRMAAEGNRFIPAVLRMENRSSKKAGQTHRFVVPVIDLPGVRVADMTALDGPVNPPAMSAPPRPELPAAGPLPEDPTFEREATPEFGAPPPLPPPDDVERLLELAERLGKRDQVAAAIQGKQLDYEPAKYQEWLRRQIREAEKKIASSGPGDSAADDGNQHQHDPSAAEGSPAPELFPIPAGARQEDKG